MGPAASAPRLSGSTGLPKRSSHLVVEKSDVLRENLHRVRAADDRQGQAAAGPFSYAARARDRLARVATPPRTQVVNYRLDGWVYTQLNGRTGRARAHGPGPPGFLLGATAENSVAFFSSTKSLLGTDSNALPKTARTIRVERADPRAPRVHLRPPAWTTRIGGRESAVTRRTGSSVALSTVTAIRGG